MRGAGPSFGIAYSFTFRTHPIPEEVQYYEITLLPRAQPATVEAAERAPRLYEAFEEFGESEAAVSEWGMSWHVTPEWDREAEGWGTKVEVLGQFHGGKDAFEVAKEAFLSRLEAKGEIDVALGHRSLSECIVPSGTDMLVACTEAASIVECAAVCTNTQPSYNRCTMSVVTGHG